MIRFIWHFIILLLLFQQTFFAQQSDANNILIQEIVKLLPDSAGDWNKSGPAVVYKGNELFKLIDGGAEIFKEYGFKQAVVQEYKNRNDNIISSEIYEMQDSASAYGIFSLFSFNTGKPASFSSEAAESDDFLIFRKGNCYISLTGINLPDKEKDELFLIAQKIDEKIISSGKPDLVLAFDPLMDSKKAYIKGILGLYNLSTLETYENFRIEEGIVVETEKSRDIILKYKTKDECEGNYLLLLKSVKNSSKYEQVNFGLESNLFKEQNGLLDILTKENYIIISSSEDKNFLNENVVKIKSLLKL